MSRSSRYDLFLREAIAEEHGLDDIDDIWLEDYAAPANTGLFDWFASNLPGPIRDEHGQPRWDAFISYASERRAELVVPLVAALEDLGVDVWLDQHEYTTGYVDDAINRGVAASAVGVLVLSPEYLHKQWTRYEFEALLLSGVTTFVLVGLALDPDAITVLDRFRHRVAAHLDVTVVELRSYRTRGLARRIRAAVRRSREAKREPLPEDASDRLVAEVDALGKEFAMIVPDPAQVRREEQRRRDAQRMRDLADLCERSFGGDWDLMREKFPIDEIMEDVESRERDWGFERP